MSYYQEIKSLPLFCRDYILPVFIRWVDNFFSRKEKVESQSHIIGFPRDLFSVKMSVSRLTWTLRSKKRKKENRRRRWVFSSEVYFLPRPILSLKILKDLSSLVFSRIPYVYWIVIMSLRRVSLNVRVMTLNRYLQLSEIFETLKQPHLPSTSLPFFYGSPFFDLSQR